MAFPHIWVVREGFMCIADIYVFEHESACRLEASRLKNGHLNYGYNLAISYVRALTKAGAARRTLEGTAETIERFRPTNNEVDAWNAAVHEHDMGLLMGLVSLAHKRKPELDEAGIPEKRPEDPGREMMEVEHYISALVNYGALHSFEYDEMCKIRRARVYGCLSNTPNATVMLRSSY